MRSEQDPPPRLAFLGVRPCDLRAIQIQDRVLGGDGHESRYAQRRAAVFIVAVNCTEPGETCFCTSMGTGPQAGPGYDLMLTELAGPEHSFIVEAGSQAGAQILDRLPVRAPDAGAAERAGTAIEAARGQMGRTMQAGGLRELLADSLQAARWDDVASRCLTCGNCTMACPTCFCTTIEDSTDLSGDHAERWQSWASCFDLDFSGLHGGPVRTIGHSRYRQWLTHKLGTWHDQFGSSGCVGCGRCIVWCPVGIDLTEEVAALRAERDVPAAGPRPDWVLVSRRDRVEPAALTAHPFTAGLTGGQLTGWLRWQSPVEYPAGQRLFDEGGRADRLWLITAGRVALDLRAPGRDRRHRRDAGPRRRARPVLAHRRCPAGSSALWRSCR